MAEFKIDLEIDKPEIKLGICERCKGTGKTDLPSLGSHVWKVSCDDCNGIGVITRNLLTCKQWGKDIRDLRVRYRLTLRELAKQSTVPMSELCDIEQGKAEIQRLCHFYYWLKDITDKLEIVIEYVVTCNESATNFYQVYSSENIESAEAKLAEFRSKDGVLKVYELVIRKSVRERKDVRK